jgi:hypothetical protein
VSEPSEIELDLDDLSVEVFELVGPENDDGLTAGHGMTEFGGSGCHQQPCCHCSCFAVE